MEVMWLAVVIGAAGLAWGLGSSSLFVDETISWRAASLPLSDLDTFVRDVEVTPPLYYLGLHAWTAVVGAEDEWLLRLPSAIAAVGLLVAVWWVASSVSDRRTAALAALLTAVSPLVLEYGQQVRAYVFAALLTTLAVGGALHLANDRGPRTVRWALVAGLLGAAAIWTHYTSLLILGPLAVWLSSRRTVALRRRLIPIAGWVIAFVAVIPLLSHQTSLGHEQGIAEAAKLSGQNLVEVFGAPFDDRSEKLAVWLIVGTAITTVSVAIAATGAAARRGSGTLMSTLAVAAPITALGSTVIGDNALLSRYAVVSAPFALLAIALAADGFGGRRGATLFVVAVAAGAAGSLYSHSDSAFYPDMRSAIQDIGEGWQRGDAIVVTGYSAIPWATDYYRERFVPDAPPPLIAGAPGAAAGLREARSVWLLTDQKTPGLDEEALARFGFRSLGPARTYGGRTGLRLIHAAPR